MGIVDVMSSSAIAATQWPQKCFCWLAQLWEKFYTTKYILFRVHGTTFCLDVQTIPNQDIFLMKCHNLGHFTNKMSRATNKTHPAFRSSQDISLLKYLGGDASTLGPANLLGPQTLYIFYLVWQQWPLNKPFSVALNASTIMQSCTLIDSTFFSVCRS